MNDMIERVARAIANGLGDEFDNAFNGKSDWIFARGEKGGRFRDCNEPTQDDYLDAARAAIEAFDANVVVGCCLSQPCHNREIYQAMIDEALKPAALWKGR